MSPAGPDAQGATALVQSHTRLVKLLRLAYSAERAAAYAYIGHAGSVKDPAEKQALTQIEADEWEHRTSVLEIMRADVLYEMGITEKEHEQFFLDGLADKRLLPIFQRVFAWGSGASYNDVDLAAPHDSALSSQYCQRVGDTSNRARPSRRLRTIAAD